MNDDLYRMPRPSRRVHVTRRGRRDGPNFDETPAPLAVDARTSCHVTPFPEAGRMADYLEADPAHLILEPSGGTGALVAAVGGTGHPLSRVTVVESHHGLATACRDRFPDCRYFFMDFLEFCRGDINWTFDRVIMNPPYAKNAARHHVAAARELLNPGGRLVALVPCNFETEGMEELEHLDENTFPNTKIRTKIILIES